MQIWKSPRREFSLYRGIGPSYATKNGGPVLKDQPNKWRFINGFWVGTKHQSVWILFRRYQMIR